jgi:hypothetical protein
LPLEVVHSAFPPTSELRTHQFSVRCGLCSRQRRVTRGQPPDGHPFGVSGRGRATKESVVEAAASAIGDYRRPTCWSPTAARHPNFPSSWIATRRTTVGPASSSKRSGPLNNRRLRAPIPLCWCLQWSIHGAARSCSPRSNVISMAPRVRRVTAPSQNHAEEYNDRLISLVLWLAGLMTAVNFGQVGP